METFNNVINSGQLVLVDFFATWCQPCKAMHPILEQVKSVLGDRIRIIKVDVDKYGVTASQYRIQSVPTLMLFRNGEVLWRTSGVVDKAELLATLYPFLTEKDEKNKGRTASCGADDTFVLQKEGGQQGIMSWVPRVATVRYCKTGTL